MLYSNIVMFFVRLQENYGDFALFFHDIYGGSVIAVLWKPQALLPKDFKVS
jgi:U3 small nucleolar RNA-associated protein 22